MGEVSILWFKKAQVFCIKNSNCVKTGKSLRAIATKIPRIAELPRSQKSVKTGKSLRAIATLFLYKSRQPILGVLSVKTGKSLRAIETLKKEQFLRPLYQSLGVKTGKSLRAIETFFTFTSSFASTNVKN